jgi:hypothetical protein
VGIVFALVLTAPVVSLQSDGAPPCDTAAFAHDLRALWPELTIVALEAGQTPPVNAWLARLEGVASGQPVLRVTGNPTPLLRALSGESCSSVVEIAASIVDGLLDELPREASAFLASATPLRPSLGIWLGGGVLQGPIQWVPTVSLGVRLRLGHFELVGASELGALATQPLSTPDGGRGNYKALPFDFEGGGGWAPHLWLGNLSVDFLSGPSIARVWAKGSPLFGTQTVVTLEPFVALAAGYTIDLPARFFAGVRIEERWSPTQAHFSVDSSSAVATRIWAFNASLLAGWRVF